MTPPLRVAACALFALLISPAAAKPRAKILKDINRAPDGSSTQLMWVESTRNGAVFSADSPETGQELWVAGATGEHRLLKDICRGASGSDPKYPIGADGIVYFQADDGKHGAELWRSDGTRKGTRMITDLHEGLEGGEPFPRFANSGRVFFERQDSDSGYGSTWCSDGTPAGTVELNPLIPGEEEQRRFWSTNDYQREGPTTYFRADETTLWKSDGTEAGTIRIMDMEAEGVPSVSSMAVIHGNVFLKAWRTDGSEEIAELWIKPANGDPASRLYPQDGDEGWNAPGNLLAVGDRVYFLAGRSEAPKLWTSDGTVAGTSEIRMIHEGVIHHAPYSLTVWKDHLYFRASGENTGARLWRSDGTDEGTVPFSELVPGFDGSEPGDFVVAGQHLYFETGNRPDRTLWRTDGTAAGTIEIMQRHNEGSTPYGWTSAAVGNSLVFISGHFTSDSALWRTGGKPRGTQRLTTGPATQAGFDGIPLTRNDGGIIFGAKVDSEHYELWRSNGTPKGTRALWSPPAGSVLPAASLGTKTILVVRNFPDGDQLWSSDGSGGGTQLLKSFPPGSGSISPEESVVVGGTCYFPVRGFTHGFWKTDGTPEGTQEVTTATGAALNPAYYSLTAFGGNVYFFAAGSGPDQALWRSDGSAQGTFPVKDLNLPSPGDLKRIGNRLSFTCGEQGQVSLWTSDGTTAGTSQVIALQGYFGFSVDLGDTQVFSFRKSLGTFHLYRSDGTAAGTQSFHYVPGGVASSSDPFPRHAVAGGTLYYVAETEEGAELWKSDGTEGGTMLVRDIRPGGDSSIPSEFSVAGDLLYFTADDGIHGRELWCSDGTTAGTSIAADIEPGPVGSDPGGLTASGGKLFFHALRARFGRELHVLDLPQR